MFDLRAFITSFPAGAVAGAVVGWVASLFSDPIKKELGDWKRRRLLRRRLYEEIAHNYSTLVIFLAPEHLEFLVPRFADSMKGHARTTVYEYALTQQELFLGLKEWGSITGIYKSLNQILGYKSGLMDVVFPVNMTASHGKNLIIVIEETILEGSLSLHLFSKVQPDISKRLNEIKAGKRRKSSDIYDELSQRALDKLLKRPSQ